MVQGAGILQEEPSQLEIFSAIHAKVFSAVQFAFSGLNARERSRFYKIINGQLSRDTSSRSESRDLIPEGDSASYALLKTLRLLADDFVSPSSDSLSRLHALVANYRELQSKTYDTYVQNVMHLLSEIRQQIDNQALPEGIARAVASVTEASIAACVKESITPSFPARPSFELHLTAPTEHLVVAHLLKDRNLIAKAQSNLVSAYVLDMGYPYESAEAEMCKQNNDIAKLLKTTRIADDLKLSIPVAFMQWRVTSQDRMSRKALAR